MKKNILGVLFNYGLQYLPDSLVERYLKYGWRFLEERRFWKLIERTSAFQALNASSVYVNCGANFGHVANVFIQKGVTAYLFEPSPKHYHFLRMRFGPNSKVHVYNRTVGDTTGKLPFYIAKKAILSECNSLYPSESRVERIDTKIEVEVIDLCDFLEKLNTPVDFLTMDIEGAEYPIFGKMIATGVYRKIRHCLVFTHADYWDDGRFDEADARVRELITQHQIANIYLLYSNYVFPAWPADWNIKGGWQNWSAV